MSFLAASAAVVLTAAAVLVRPSPGPRLRALARVASAVRPATRAAPVAAALAAHSPTRSLGARRGEDAIREGVVELLRALAVELRTGGPSGQALAAAIEVLRHAARYDRLARALQPVAALARTGHDPTDALRHAARTPGAEGLALLAACWRVSALSGAGLSDVAQRLAHGLRQDLAHLRRLQADLAGPRATAVMLALLPVFGLAMASAIAAEPLRFLFTTPAGGLCLALGLSLQLAGLVWTRRLVDRVRRGAQPATEPA